MNATIRTVCLFDIDGTLLLGDGAGRGALEAALRSVLGLRGPLETVSFAGRTDRAIVTELLSRNGFEPSDELRERCFRSYLEHLPAQLRARRGILPRSCSRHRPGLGVAARSSRCS